jgi:ribonuclease BN (tRNA processing enzyme)
MRVTVVGCSPAWPNPGGAQSGYLVEGSARLLLDCGPGVLPRLRELEPWPHVDAVAITHFHLDHWGDIVPWTWGTQFGPGRNSKRPVLFVPSGGREALHHFGSHFGTETMFTEAFDLREYSSGETFEAAGLDVTPVRVPHYEIETYGFRVTDGERTLAYSGDSAPSDALVEVARDADLFLCEATLAEPREAGDLRGHLAAEEALDAFHRAGARRLVVVHRPHELPLDESLERARDGDTFDV